MSQAPPAAAKPVPRWHLHRRLYDWVLHWANTRYGTPALGTLSFAESSFFPIPPDPLLMALALAKPKRAFYYSLVCSGTWSYMPAGTASRETSGWSPWRSPERASGGR